MKLKIFFSVIFFFILLSKVNLVSAGEIYIATNGNDTTGNGTKELPYLTLAKADNSVKAGDIIYVRGGTYTPNKNDWQVTNLKGEVGKEIIISSYLGESVVVDGTNAQATSSSGVVQISNSSYVRFDGFTVQNSPEGRGISVYEGNNIVIANNLVKSVKYKCIGVAGEFIYVENNEVTNCSLENENAKNGSSGAISQAISTYKKANGYPSKDIHIKYNHVHENWGEGIDFIFVDGGSAIGNKVHDNLGVNIYVDTSRNIEIRDNLVTRETTSFLRYDGLHANGITVANENNGEATYATNIKITNNLVGDGVRKGINYYWTSGYDATYSNLEISNNTVFGQTDDAIEITNINETTSGNIIKDNIISAGTVSGVSLDFQEDDKTGWTIELTEMGQDTDTDTDTDSGTNKIPVSGSEDGRVWRFWNSLTGAHFYTYQFKEIEDIQKKYSSIWSLEKIKNGIADSVFSVYKYESNKCSSGIPVYRFYGGPKGTHFYTIDEKEKKFVIDNFKDWIFEGVKYCADNAKKENNTPLYRFWSEKTGSHFYTNSEEEYNHVVKNLKDVYTYEKIAYYVNI